jgi:hypothetical protein
MVLRKRHRAIHSDTLENMWMSLWMGDASKRCLGLLGAASGRRAPRDGVTVYRCGPEGVTRPQGDGNESLAHFFGRVAECIEYRLVTGCQGSWSGS